MKLVFRKDDESKIQVFNVIDGEEKPFSYVEMTKALLASREMEDPVIEEGFSEAETASIQSMVEHINYELAGVVSEEDDTGENA